MGTGIIRRFDDLGRIVIPKEVRRKAKVGEGDPMEIEAAEDGSIVLRRYRAMEELLNSDSCKNAISVLRRQYPEMSFIPLDDYGFSCQDGVISEPARVWAQQQAQVNGKKKSCEAGMAMFPVLSDNHGLQGYLLVVGENGEIPDNVLEGTELVANILGRL